ncbi:hypothetical protein HF995_13380 [Sanguibacter hominis ATCC BAA-789]|uniref:Fibronectin type-III domain-containing protein n=1 Tax=Sanguibacter hominis ATCC BAA-789 TaxID=1312740 RepID=A0A9X5ISP6_9MICO|nr:fibronectin type III domain-containing protein [Sanguibacter hominis]NKX94248.1 hypothetical protein [Sanguibacter hominis ATCC BAA-789]
MAAVLALVSVPVALKSSPPEVTSAAFSASAWGRATITASAQWEATSPTALALSNTTARVTWVAAEGHTTYTLQRATNASFTAGLTAVTVSGTTSNVTGLAQNTTYYFRVRGAANTNLPWSAVASAKTGPGSSVTKVELMPYSDMRLPHGLVVDSSNVVWAADYNTGSLLRVPAAGGTVTTVLDATFPTKSIRQISLTPTSGDVAMVVNVEDETPNAQSGKDGIYLKSGATARRWVDPAPYGLAYSATRSRYYATGLDAAGRTGRAVYECTTAWACVRIWESPVWMAYLSIAPGSSKLTIGSADRIYSLDLSTKNAVIVATLGGDVRGVYSPTENLYFVADYADGLVWRVQYVPSTGATNSQLILTGLPGTRAMATTSNGDLIVANSAPAANINLRGIWKYAGLGR